MTNVTNTEDSLNTVTTESGSNLTSWLVPTQQQTTGEIWRIPQSPPSPPCWGRDLIFVFAVRTFNPNLSGSICLPYVLSICQNTMVDCWQELKHCIVIPMIYWTLEVLLSLWPSQSRPGIRIAMTSKNWQCWWWNCLIARKRQVISNMLLTLYNAGLPGGSTGRYFLHKIQKP